jgi:hypothetical protein
MPWFEVPGIGWNRLPAAGFEFISTLFLANPE